MDKQEQLGEATLIHKGDGRTQEHVPKAEGLEPIIGQQQLIQRKELTFCRAEGLIKSWKKKYG